MALGWRRRAPARPVAPAAGLEVALLPLRRVLLAALVLAAAPPAPMPLRLPLAIGRGRPQFSLGLRRFCRHACTSWQCAVWCIAFLRSAASRAAAELPLPAARPDSDGIPLGLRSGHLRTSGKSPRNSARRNLPRSPEEWPHCCFASLDAESPLPFPRVSVTIRCGRCFPLVMPFLWEFPPRAPDEVNKRCGEASLLGGERALPFWGGSRQPLDRQV